MILLLRSVKITCKLLTRYNCQGSCFYLYNLRFLSYMVVNGACKDKDMAHFRKYMENEQLIMDYDASRQLLALQVFRLLIFHFFLTYRISQGDGAKTVVARLSPSLDLSKMLFMTSINNVTVAGLASFLCYPPECVCRFLRIPFPFLISL